MGRLVISHHKSYHPYRRDNIQRVRDDEEKARRKEEDEDGRMMLADSEARIALLRKRNDGRKRDAGRDDDEPEPEPGPSAPPPAEPIATTSSGHINLFADLEQQAMRTAIAASKKTISKAAASHAERGFPMAPPEKDLKPWYSSTATGADVEPSHIRGRDKETREDRQNRDLMRKSQSDPLTSINTQLALHARTQPSSSRARPSAAQTPRPRIAFDGGSGQSSSAVHERLTREAAERARAAELIRRRRRELDGSATPSTVHGGMDEPYSDRYNRRETEEAQRRRQQRDRRYH